MNLQHIFHKSQLEKLKKECKGVTYVSHLQEKDNYFIKVRIKNPEGGTDEVTFPLKTHPSQLTSKEYNFIKDVINSRDYAGSEIDVQ